MRVNEPLHFGLSVHEKVVMSNPQPNNPLHGITLETILDQLVEQHGWAGLGKAHGQPRQGNH
jgi:hypothetical protein